MKRGASMRRTTPLHNRTAMRRTPGQTTRTTVLARRSRKPSAVPDPDWEALRLALYTRAGGRCERRGCSLDDLGMHAHHRQLRSRGGGHTLDNLVALCPEHHRRVHDGPALATLAGFVVASWAAPEETPVRLHDGRLVLLTPDGGYAPTPTSEEQP